LTDEVLCFASDGAVVSVSAGDRSGSEARSLLQLQSGVQGLPPSDLAGLTGVLWSQRVGKRRTSNWELVLAASGAGSEALLGGEQQQQQGGASEALLRPGGGFDGAVIAMIDGMGGPNQ
jgi:hypothetical protein